MRGPECAIVKSTADDLSDGRVMIADDFVLDKWWAGDDIDGDCDSAERAV
jgi:hypothetical protein